MEPTTLDLRDVPAGGQREALETAFEALDSGGVLRFLTPDDPRPLIRSLIASHWGRFDWAPLREGGDGWISQIGKRDSPGPNGIFEMLSADHRRCDDLFAAAEAAANDGNLELATDLFGRWNLGMERHFNIEEQGFFVEFERQMGMQGGGPTAVMREEHQQVRGMLRRMAAELEQPNLEGFVAACETMLYLMEQHNMKEEQMLYPMADDTFGGEVEDLLKRLYLF